MRIFRDGLHLVDATFELFRYHFAPSDRDPDQGAITVLGSLRPSSVGCDHVGVAGFQLLESGGVA
jgi:hypothetical protein